MINVQKIGEFQPLDEDGYIVNTSSVDNVHSPWKEAVEELKRVYIEKFGEQLHSIYLRGSVPRGKGIEGISDLDTIVLIKAEFSSKVDLGWFDGFTNYFYAEYPFINEVELTWVNQSVLLTDDRRRSTRIQLAIYGACIWGENVTPDLPKLKPGKSVAIHAWAIEKQIESALQKFNERETSRGVEQACTWITKAFLRTGCELVMGREKQYTRDLYPCYELFSKYYAEQAGEMYQALEYALNPVSDREKLSEYVTRFGGWLSEEAKKQGFVRD